MDLISTIALSLAVFVAGGIALAAAGFTYYRRNILKQMEKHHGKY